MQANSRAADLGGEEISEEKSMSSFAMREGGTDKRSRKDVV